MDDFSRFDYRRRISLEAIKRFKERIREITSRTRGRSIAGIAVELGRYLRGWNAYYGFAEALSPLKELDSWIRRRLRCYLWKQWGRLGYRELRKRGVSRDLARNTAKSAHGPWRLSRRPGLTGLERRVDGLAVFGWGLKMASGGIGLYAHECRLMERAK